MTWTIVASAAAGSAGGATATTTAVDTTGSTLLVVIGSTITGDPINISDSKSNTWISGPQFPNVGNQSVDLGIFYVNNPIVGSGHTFSNNNGGFGAIGMVAASGHTGGTPNASSATAYGAGTTTEQPGSITPSANDALLLFFTSLSNGTSGAPYSVNDGFTIQSLFDGISSNYGMLVATLDQTIAAAINPTMTRSVASSIAPDISTIVAFNGTASAGGVAVYNTMMLSIPGGMFSIPGDPPS